MLCFQRCRKKSKQDFQLEKFIANDEDEINDTHQAIEEQKIHHGTKTVYFASTMPRHDVIHTLQILDEDLRVCSSLKILRKSIEKSFQIFTDERECVDYIASITIEVFLVINGSPSATLINAMDALQQLDSVFVYSPSIDSIRELKTRTHPYLIHWCENDAVLIDKIYQSRRELDQQRALLLRHRPNGIFNMVSNSFVFFQLFRNLLKHLPKTAAAKTILLTTCRSYYRKNPIELANIDEFDRTYQPADAISWYTKETFVYK